MVTSAKDILKKGANKKKMAKDMPMKKDNKKNGDKLLSWIGKKVDSDKGYKK